MAINAGDTTYYQAKRGIVQDGLVLNLDAAVDQSYPGNGTTWSNLTNTTASGTLVNGPTFTNEYGGGVVFDATDDYVTLNNMSSYQLLTSDYISIDVWFKSNSFAGFSRKYLFENRSSTGSQGTNPFLIFVDRTSDIAGNLRVYGGQGQTNVANISIDTIYNLVMTIDTTSSTNNFNIYLDNVKTTDSENITNTANISDVMYLGKAYVENDYRWNGPIYRFSMYNKILSDEEVLQNYNATKGRFE